MVGKFRILFKLIILRKFISKAYGMRTPLELRHLRTFHALAESTTLTQAAERLFISQSALSQQLKLLEDVYGLPLVERRT